MATTAIFVLGMHRSGTSATAATLGLLGAHLGGHLIPPRPDNPKGFFEDSRCVNTNIKLLRNFGTDGTGGVALPVNWKEHPEVQALRPRMKEILGALGRKQVYAIKDPRLSLTAELWFEVAASLGQEIKVVVAARHPLQVAKSLEKRDNLARFRAYLSWLLHTIQAVRLAGSYPHAYLAFEDLQTQTDECVARLVKLVARPQRFFVDEQRRAAIEEFLDPSLVNSRDTVDEDFPDLGRELSTLYEALSKGDEVAFKRCLQQGSLLMYTKMTALYRAHLAAISKLPGAAAPEDARSAVGT